MFSLLTLVFGTLCGLFIGWGLPQPGFAVEYVEWVKNTFTSFVGLFKR
jgi:hypothetical protein